jgi:hypothetical protein
MEPWMGAVNVLSMSDVQAAHMEWSFNCACGARVSAAGRDELVAAAAKHVEESHASVAVGPSRADVLAMAECVEEDPAVTPLRG